MVINSLLMIKKTKMKPRLKSKTKINYHLDINNLKNGVKSRWNSLWLRNLMISRAYKRIIQIVTYQTQ